MSSDTENKLWNFANVLTTFRLVVAPIFIGLCIYVYKYDNQTPLLVWTTAILYMLAVASDKFDGDYARKYNLVTNYGKIIDPIADKFLVLGGFAALSYCGWLPWFFTIIVAFRDFGITALRFALLKKTVIAASPLGKWKTVSQMFLIFLFVFPFKYIFPMDQTVAEIFGYLCTGVMWIALVMTIASFVDYLISAIQIVREK